MTGSAGTTATHTTSASTRPILVLALLALVLALSSRALTLLPLRLCLTGHLRLLSCRTASDKGRTTGRGLSLRFLLSTLNNDPVPTVGLDTATSSLRCQETGDDGTSRGVHLCKLDKCARLVTDDFDLCDFRSGNTGVFAQNLTELGFGDLFSRILGLPVVELPHGGVSLHGSKTCRGT